MEHGVVNVAEGSPWPWGEQFVECATAEVDLMAFSGEGRELFFE
jgi:hypothetical protein